MLRRASDPSLRERGRAINPDEKKHEEDPARRRFTLLPGEVRESAPHEPPKLTLVVNADRKLYEAVDLGDLPRAAAWLERGANPNVQDPLNGRTALMEAISPSHDPAIAELLIAKGADVRVSEHREGHTALHHAAMHGREEHLRVILDSGRADIDARDRVGKTPLHLTAEHGRIEATALLVSRGADVSIRDHDGRTPLDCMLRNFARGEVLERERKPLERLLSGFLTATIVHAPPDSLIVRVDTFHTKFTDAERHAREHKTVVVPAGGFPAIPRVGNVVRCDTDLTPALSEAWRETRRQFELRIERAQER